MNKLIQINQPLKNGGSYSRVITFHGNILFRKGFTHRLFRVGSNLGAWHILGFRITFHTINTSDINKFSPFYQKPLFTINKALK